MSEDKLSRTPTHYTDYEGGGWIEWSYGPVSEKLLSQAWGVRDIGHLNGDDSVIFHSLMFDNGDTWDSLNGYRQ